MESLKLEKIRHPEARKFIETSIELCKPDRVFICDDSPQDLEHIRKMALETGEEHQLSTPGHTYHFDGYFDQGRDRGVTKLLVPPGERLDSYLNQMEREKGLQEVLELLRGSMRGKTMIVRFLVLGPPNSLFTIPCMECTDSWYVAHSVSLLYRPGYSIFAQLPPDAEIFKTLHSAGRLNERMQSIDHDKKRIYIDYTQNTVYSVNTQYAGNSVGFKKLALRLAIRKAHREGWLAEHFMIMGVKGPGGRKTYLAGAFPSGCGKTSTAMLPGESILADDLAYVRAVGGKCRMVNVEAGIFGIIRDVNPRDDPIIYRVLSSPAEIIFSNVLVREGRPYWIGMGEELPEEGINFFGEWRRGIRGPDGEEVPPAHPNARYAVNLRALPNADPELDNPEGVEVRGIMFGGRDYRAYVPVQESFDWAHGVVIYGGCLETETTFAITEKPKVEINVMSLQDFLSIPLADYIRNYLRFGEKLVKPPLIFAVNYFLRDLRTGEFLTDKLDKHVWVKWMELRVNGDVDAVKTPTGRIPRWKDLAPLFKQLLGKEYPLEDYKRQFTLRIPENLEKINRALAFWRGVLNVPGEVLEIIEAQKGRLEKARQEFGKDYISPEFFGGC
ncbi:MAG: phosphoenolpyruvate carboxykinase (GTP) [Candidatus Hadarchaeales archaeon]